jgi:hypothetical protein
MWFKSFRTQILLNIDDVGGFVLQMNIHLNQNSFRDIGMDSGINLIFFIGLKMVMMTKEDDEGFFFFFIVF